MVFSEPEKKKGGSVFAVSVNGKTVAADLDVVRAAGGVRKGYLLEVPSVAVREDGNLKIDLQVKSGETVLSGVELRRVGG